MPTTLAGTVLAATEGKDNPLVPAIPELVVGIIAFLLLLAFLARRVYPVFEKTYAERTEAIEGSIAKAQQDRAEAQELLARYQAQLAEARDEAGRIRTEAQSQRAEIVEEARVEACAEAQRILEQAGNQISAERQSALAQLRRDVGTLAVDLASRIVGESLQDDARQRGTVERYLAELEGRPQASAGSTAGTTA